MLSFLLSRNVRVAPIESNDRRLYSQASDGEENMFDQLTRSNGKLDRLNIFFDLFFLLSLNSFSFDRDRLGIS